jgi:hypothetical protein
VTGVITPIPRRQVPRPLLLSWDLTNVLFFVATGRTAHDIDTGLAAFGRVAAPFVIALIVAWVAARAWRDVISWRTGTAVWLVTVALGMLVRRAVFEGGTALPFVIVTTVYLGTVLLGWRWIARWWERRRAE